jgi:3-deoxy-manno-octulosonate cytidylyltransferase (CMP-KDO synthetase)
MKVIAMIPARLKSTRLPEKMIQDLEGLPVIMRTYFAVLSTGLFDTVYVVTDSKKIATLTRGHNVPTIESSAEHETGSDRLAEAAVTISADIIINVQGDEPFIDKNSLSLLIECFKNDPHKQIDLASLMTPLRTEAAIVNPNTVKVITDLRGRALYFSRSAIPYLRDKESGAVTYKHKGVYAFRKSALLEFTGLPIGPLERAEKIEAIRYLENAKHIQMVITDIDAPGIDTAEDLDHARQLIKQT